MSTHAIQLETIKVVETTLVVHDFQRAHEDKVDVAFHFQNNHSKYDPDSSSIMVGIRGVVGDEKTDPIDLSKSSPFFIRVELRAVFKVDAQSFPVDEVENWAKTNAPIILYPFLREHIYGLALRAGIKELIIPMINLPVYKLAPTTKAS